jgi:short-subunit dehydrogenase
MSGRAGTFELRGRTVIITGAASGIGRALARALAAKGCNLALADVNQAGLQATADELASNAVRITRHVLDVADPDPVAALPQVIRDTHGRAEILVNNAGVALAGTFQQVSAADFDWLMNINFGGVVRMTRAFLPILLEAPEARLVNLSSLFGLIAPPGQTAYSASKFAVRGFSESLRQELRGTSVGVTVVHPGGVATSIADNARIGARVPQAEQARLAKFNALLTLPPDHAAAQIVRGIERRRPRLIVGRDARFAALLERLRPVSYWPTLERLTRRQTAS